MAESRTEWLLVELRSSQSVIAEREVVSVQVVKSIEICNRCEPNEVGLVHP